jgi:hypothetical protein
MVTYHQAVPNVPTVNASGTMTASTFFQIRL